MQFLLQNLVDILRLRRDLPLVLQKVVFLIPASEVRMIITPTTSSCIRYYKIDESHIGAIGVFPLISRCPQRSIVVKRWNHPLSSDHVYDSLIFSNVVLHLFLDVCIVFQQIAQMLLAVGQIFLESGVLAVEILIYSFDFIALLTDVVQFPSLLIYTFLYFF